MEVSEWQCSTGPGMRHIHHRWCFASIQLRESHCSWRHGIVRAPKTGRLGQVQKELSIVLPPLLLRKIIVQAIHAQLLHLEVRSSVCLSFEPFLWGRNRAPRRVAEIDDEQRAGSLIISKIRRSE